MPHRRSPRPTSMSAATARPQLTRVRRRARSSPASCSACADTPASRPERAVSTVAIPGMVGPAPGAPAACVAAGAPWRGRLFASLRDPLGHLRDDLALQAVLAFDVTGRRRVVAEVDRAQLELPLEVPVALIVPGDLAGDP